MKRLTKDFFLQDTDIVAQQIIGKKVTFYEHSFIITETESYNETDPASHTFEGKLTKRNKIMFSAAGVFYVYLIYGIYYCINFVTGSQGKGEAVLLRAALNLKTQQLISGPGKLCKEFSINNTHNGLSFISNSLVFVEDIGLNLEYITTKRIGITKGADLLKRFLVEPKIVKNLQLLTLKHN